MQQSICPSCGSPTTIGQRFCGNCGATLSAGCPSCGMAISPGTRFCPNCGTAIGGGGPQQSGGCGAQSAWGAQAARGQASSNRPLLIVLLVVLLMGIGGLVYWQFPDLFSSSSTTPPAPPDTTSPVISEIKVQEKSETTARIIWETNEATSSQVEYGKTKKYGTLEPAEPANDPTGSTSAGVVTHSITLTKLKAGTTYHYRVISKDAAGNETKSPDKTFKTTESSD